MDRHDLFEVAAARREAGALPYAGALTPAEAHQLASEGAAVIVDIRTRPEWEFVGHVEDAPLIEWKSYGAPRPDPAFVDKLAARFPRDAAILLLCRSGVRSHHARHAGRVHPRLQRPRGIRGRPGRGRPARHERRLAPRRASLDPALTR
jgi:rhodanese-related sulfurtransferase